MRSILAAIMVLAVCAPSWGSETQWLDIAPDVTMRLVSSDTITDEGTLWMGLEIDMPESTKTYWRIPGESGIPLVIDGAASSGIGALEIAWPYPRRESDAGYLDHAYYGRIVLPLEVEITAQDPLVDLDLKLGICSDVCVPVSARLVLSPDFDTPDNANAFRIHQALATVPLPDEGAQIFGDAAFDSDRGTVAVVLEDAGIDVQSVIAEIAGTMILFDVPSVSDDGSALSFAMLGRMEPQALAEPELRLTFETSDGPFEVVRPLELR